MNAQAAKTNVKKAVREVKSLRTTDSKKSADIGARCSCSRCGRCCRCRCCRCF